MPTPINSQHFERFCRNRSGQPFRTLFRHNQFTIEVSPASEEFQITFISENGNRWTAKSGLIGRYLYYYGLNGGSLHPSDYPIKGPISAPRMVSLFKKYLKHLPCSNWLGK